VSNLLFFSDLHAHNFPDCAETVSEGVNSRLLDCLNIFKQITQIAKDNNVKDIVFGGDLFHVPGRVEVSVFNAVVNAVVQMQAETDAHVFLVVGNHDQYNRSGTIHALKMFKHLGSGFTVIDSTHYVDTGRRSLLLCAYSPFAEKVHEYLELAEKHNPEILVLHQGLSGVPVGKSGYTLDETLSPTDLPKGTWLNLLGHYHENRAVSPNTFFIGSPLQHNWGDEGSEKVCLLARGDSLEMIPLESPKFITLPIGDEDASFVPAAASVLAAGNFVRVRSPLLLSTRDIASLREAVLKYGARFVKYEYLPEGGDSPVTEDIPTGAIIDTASAIQAYTEASDPLKRGLDLDRTVKMGLGFME